MRRCQFCGFWYTPPNFHRVPSEACDTCCLKIAEKPELEPDFTPGNLRRITYRPDDSAVLQ